MDVNNDDKDVKGSAVLYYTRGNLYAQQRRYEEAVQCYDIAIKTGREETEFYNKKGDVLVRLGRYEEAVPVDENVPDMRDARNREFPFKLCQGSCHAGTMSKRSEMMSSHYSIEIHCHVRQQPLGWL